MRLDDYDNDINVGEARGGGGLGGGGGGGFLLGLLPMIGSRFGCGGIVVVLLLLAVFGGLGNLGGMLGGGGGTAPQVSAPSRETVQQVCDASTARRDTCRAFSNAQNTWEKIFASQNQQFSPPKLQFFSGSGQSGCGAAMSAMGPFYCPTDRGIYLDTSFFD